jgi:hypothetical protein
LALQLRKKHGKPQRQGKILVAKVAGSLSDKFNGNGISVYGINSLHE